MQIVCLIAVFVFSILTIISIFKPGIGGFWMKYLKVKEPTRIQAISANFIIAFIFAGIGAFTDPDRHYSEGMSALKSEKYTEAIQEFSQLEPKSKYFKEKEALIEKVKNEAKKHYDVKIKKAITDMDMDTASSLIDVQTRIAGAATINKQKAKLLINAEALKLKDLMLQSEKDGNFEQAVGYAAKLQKVEKFKNEAEKKIEHYNREISLKKAEEDMSKEIQAKALAEEKERQKYLSKEETRRSSQISEPSQPSIGGTLRTSYFEITLNDAAVGTSIATGNPFIDQEQGRAGSGNKFIVLDVTFKNIDNESRMPTDGALYFLINGKEYKFDKTEVILAEGWGLFFDQLNPFTKIRTRIVYKVPAELRGTVYWQPGRADKKHRFVFNL